ncbi:BGTF surface domain-containing protein [Haladaptatus sp. NG-WS-4]
MRLKYISMLLAVLVVASFSAGGTAALASHSVESVDGATFDHDTSDANNSSVSLDYEGEKVVLDNAPNQTISGTSTLDSGTNLSVQVHATGTFFKSTVVSVQPNGTFNATFDFEEYEHGTEFGVIVALAGNNSTGSKPLLVVEGVLRNASAPTTTTTLATTTDKQTKTTATAVSDGEATTEMKAIAETTTTTTHASESGGQPGFGLVVALAALAGSAFLFRRRYRS